ncbi:MAG: imidazole glycerol phosphate synthase subunit HisH [Flavobacteriales bacterium]|nr:imidazole glycerol phosphate synthase subunit HisH [Flavobacteriales bacterium]
MSAPIIGLVDYGAGNAASVRRLISKLGYRSRLVNKHEDFEFVTVLFVPGVGAFPSAMEALTKMNLVKPILDFANSGKPVVGVCLGMQLLADSSEEMGLTKGLGLIPGEVKALSSMEWHIGWNTLDCVGECSIASKSDGQNFYYNHSYEFQAPKEYIVGVVEAENPIVSIVRKHNIFGMQFHPEISQISGFKLMRRLLEEFTDA